MKKTFPLALEGKNPLRLLEATKHEIRKYIQRERGKKLPVGVDYWDFDCKFGTTADDAVTTHVAEITPLIDGVVQNGGTQFYVEIVAKPGVRKSKVVSE